MRYISDDNKVFNSEQECLEHEKVLNEEKIKREKLITEMNKRKDEVMAAYNSFTKLLNKFNDDYDEPLVLNDFSYLVNSLFTKGIWHL